MPKGYWIGRVDVKNDEGYKPYAAANAAIFKKFGGKFVIRGGKFEAPEGTARSRNVVDRISRLCRRARLLPLAGISGEHQKATAAFDRRYPHHRGLRRPAALTLRPVAFSTSSRYTRARNGADR